MINGDSGFENYTLYSFKFTDIEDNKMIGCGCSTNRYIYTFNLLGDIRQLCLENLIHINMYKEGIHWKIHYYKHLYFMNSQR